MKPLISLLILFTLFSCSLKDAADNDFKSQSKVTPIAESKKLAEVYGDGTTAKFSLKIPLTESSIGYYDVDDILGNGQISVKERNLFERVVDNIKLALFKTGIGLGFFNRMKFSTTFNFDFVDPEYIKSAKVKRVFFTTEDCRPEDITCDDSGRTENDFNLVSEFFVNLSPSSDIIDDESESMSLSEKEYEEISKISFAKDEVFHGFNGEEFRSQTLDELSDDFIVNIVNFKNKTPYLSLNFDAVTEEDRMLFLAVKKNRARIKKYLKSSKFKALIKSVRVVEGGITLILKKDIQVNMLEQAIVADQNPKLKNMFIFRLNSNTVEAKKLFKSELFKDDVKDISLIGKSLFVEVKDNQVESFREKVFGNDKALLADLDIFKVDRCVFNNCIDLAPRNINLVPIIEKSPRLSIDTFLSVVSLRAKDFKYNGYIEVELELDLPI